jgi:DNA-binding Xre family transcriptional regulator
MARKKNTAYLTPALRNEIRRLVAAEYQSMDELQRLTGVNKSTLSRIITGERTDVMLSTLGQIAKALHKRLIVRFE